MSSELNKKVKAAVVGNKLRIKFQTIYHYEFDLEIDAGDLAKFKKEEIEKIVFKNCVMIEIPTFDCLSSYAPNFKVLRISNSRLTRITYLDLAGFDQLIELDLDGNEIEVLPPDLFIEAPNLEHIRLARNKIKFIDEDILDDLRNLKSFDLSENPGIDCNFVHLDNEDGVDLALLKKKIKRCKPDQQVWKIVNEQKKKIEILEKKNEIFEKEISDLKHAVTFQKFDFTIKVNGKEFKVQKEVLVGSSPILDQMIRDNEDADTLELKDISEATFEEILNYMHTKQYPKANSNFMELYAASGRLQMNELNDLCTEKLIDKVTPENAFEILGLCKKFPNIELQKKAYAEYGKSLEN